MPKEVKANKKRISQQTLPLIQERRRLKLNRNKSEADEKMYKNKCRMVKKAAREDKVKWLEEQCRNIEQYDEEFKAREVYKMIKNVNRKWQPKTKMEIH